MDPIPRPSDTAMWPGSLAQPSKQKMVGDNRSQEGDLLTPGMLAIPSPATEVTRLRVDIEGAQDYGSQSARQTPGTCLGLQSTGGKQRETFSM